MNLYYSRSMILVMVKKMKKIRDIKGLFTAVLSDLLKASDCIPVMAKY